jgi:glyceraldehyde 3-phosphate dehydrogenase
MAIKIGINGLGRIGRAVLRAIFESSDHANDIEIVKVNGPANNHSHAHFIKYDSVHGTFPFAVESTDDFLIIDGNKIPVSHERDLSNLSWDGVDIVLECTGHFNDKGQASMHLSKGAKKVIVSAPCKDADATIVKGVNENILNANNKVISIGSCTTNCLAPVAKILNGSVGIESGFMTTIHAYTNDQRVLDGSHDDLRRARACALSMIPTSTGAAKSIGLVLPELAGKLDGSAIRVPVPNVSLIDLSFISSRDTTAEEINSIFTATSLKEMKGVLTVSKDKLVSIDFNHSPYSAIVDPFETKVINKRFCRVIAWYDNEWGFSNRMLDVTKILYRTMI